MKIRRIIYLFYYLKNLDKRNFRLFLNHASKESGLSKQYLLFDVIASVLIFNISLLDYFYFRFYSMEKSERRKWAGTGYLYEYQLKMNPKGARLVLEDKLEFLNRFQPFVKRHFFDLQALNSDRAPLEKLLSNSADKLVLKGSRGQVGAEVEVISCKEFTPSDLVDYMMENNFDLLEEYVVQHPSLMAISPSGLNTVRIFTQIHDGEVKFLGARFRISVNSPVDNMGAGNLAAPVDIETGVVTGPGVYSDITKEDQDVHPVTGHPIAGFTIPYWKDVIDLSRRAAHFTPENRSVGWDIAITEKGPELIEGNHNWCKILWQLPLKKGMKSELEKYIWWKKS
jgi:hypothetical protein